MEETIVANYSAHEELIVSAASFISDSRYHAYKVWLGRTKTVISHSQLTLKVKVATVQTSYSHWQPALHF